MYDADVFPLLDCIKPLNDFKYGSNICIFMECKSKTRSCD